MSKQISLMRMRKSPFALAAIVAGALVFSAFVRPALSQGGEPTPLLQAGHPVDWWFAFKLNVAVFPGCSMDHPRICRFGGKTDNITGAIGQRFVFASSEDKTLQSGHDCLGDEPSDPVGATFDEIYNGSLNYVLWNDQFYGDPIINASCTLPNDNCPGPWAHSKGMVAWNDNGQGFIMQVTTPDWPGSGSPEHVRARGNTLGCTKDNNVAFSQSFFALKLTKDDLKIVLNALKMASVATRPDNPQIVRNGGPPDVQSLVSQLGQKSTTKTILKETLSSGVILVAKPSALHVPPWQMVSAALGAVSLRVASWRTEHDYGSTGSSIFNSSSNSCWDASLGDPGKIEIATSGSWNTQSFSLNANGLHHDGNHAKIGVSIESSHPYSIFGDMNEQGKLFGTSAQCDDSQNGRGGLFFVVEDAALHNSVADLIKGDSAPSE